MRALHFNPSQTRPQRYARSRHAGRENGFSLIEVLISILILSVGVLGSIGMLVSAMQSNKEAHNQAVAASFAKELAERMRGNHTVAIKTSSTDNPYLFDVTLPPSTTVATPSVNCFTTGCPVAKDTATWDVAEWQQRVQNALPSARAKICFDQAPFDSAGRPRWDCSNTGDVSVLKMSWTRSNTAGELEFAGTTGVPLVVVPLTAGSSE